MFRECGCPNPGGARLRVREGRERLGIIAAVLSGPIQAYVEDQLWVHTKDLRLGTLGTMKRGPESRPTSYSPMLWCCLLLGINHGDVSLVPTNVRGCESLEYISNGVLRLRPSNYYNSRDAGT